MKVRKKKMIYNSRNYSILLNKRKFFQRIISTTVEIILYYLTFESVEIEAQNLQQ